MGQYYKAVNLDKKEFLRPDWLKLMEHSWIENDNVQSIELLLIEGGPWDKCRIVWAGDYADNEKEGTEFFKHNSEAVTEDNPTGETNIYGQCEDFVQLKFLIEAIPKDHIYLVNFDKKEYVDKTKLTATSDPDYILHPLPLLTCEGNGRGGGDFRGEDPKGLIGSWARNCIGLRNAIPEGFTELIFDLVEE